VVPADDRDIVVIEFLRESLFPRPPPHPGILFVDVDPALVLAEGCDRKRVLLDHRVYAMPHPQDLVLFLPLFSHVVIDDQDPCQLVLLV